jgi:hypothetical protein
MYNGSEIVAPLTTHPHHVAFATLVLHRMRGLVEWIRQQPAPANNIIDEALSLGFAMVGGTPFDIQRVYELVGCQTGTNGVMVWKDGEAQIVGRTIDLVLRSIARPDQAPVCSGRAADMMLSLHEFDFADARGAALVEREYLGRLAKTIAFARGPIGREILQALPEYRRGALATHAASKLGRDWFESFGPAAATFPGPEWEDPYVDEDLDDGNDPQTTRTGDVEGW